MLIIRNLAFYLIFYGFSVVYVLASLAAMYVSLPLMRAIVHRWCLFHRSCCKYLLGIALHYEGKPSSDTAFYVIRHESYFEAIDVPAWLHFPAVFAKDELFGVPGWGWGAKVYGLIPVARSEGARTLRAMVRAAKDRFAQGRDLVIFPEGTRIAHGQEAPLQAGFAGLYKLIGTPVVPVAVNSGPLYHRWLKRPGVITYRFGDPVPSGLPREEAEERVLKALNALN